MKLKGQKVQLRAAEPSDVDVIYQWENDPENWLVSNTIAPYSKDQILNFIQNENDIFASNQTRFMIEDIDRNAVGCIDLFDFDPKNHRVGTGILVDPSFRGRGYGKEALQLLVDYCLEVLQVRCVFAEVISTNAASLELFEKGGFQRTGVRKEWLWDGRSYVDQYFYQRFKV